ncbi:hypothetical protein L7F22_045444 [Adiantum nelumboides]|nr:hypothetical protein [Adiantum nelumboides]
MQVGGVVKDAPDVSTQPRSALAESKQLLLEYPTGVEGALAASSSSAHEELIDVQEHEAVADAIPEVEISRFASIVIDDEEFVFLHDIEKACSLRMDECPSLLKVTANTIYTDSQSALAVARNPVFHACTKHIEGHYHYVRERLLAGEISLAYVPTHDNLADLFTKALSREKLEALRKALGLLPFVD